ncbi:MAG: ASKHA domain-containing protein, partial [Atribacterota bacterium]
GENILEVLQREGMEIDAYCGGFGSCGKCQVQVLRGLVSKPTSQEIKHLKERTQEGYHLACQAILVEDVDIDISASLARQIPVLVESGEAWLEEPPVSRTELVVHKPMLSERCSLQRTVEQNLGGEKPSDWTLRALEGLSRLEDRDELRFEVVSDKGGVRWFNPVSQDHSFLGVAIDIGTTTVACELLDLANGVSLQRTGSLNRQATFGADVVSRLRTIQDNHGALVTLQELVISTINDLIQEGCQKAGKDPGRIFAVTFAGNTIMEHILLGVSPLSIGVAPYVPVFCRSYIISAQLLHLVVNPHAQVFIFPSVAGYVGGDIVAGMAAHGLDEKNGILLYVDIGTNGEIALVDHGTIYCCGTAAGPAFEGAQIKHGTRATLGAISSVEVEDGQLKIYTIGDTAPRGVCGTGLIDALSCLVKEGL